MARQLSFANLPENKMIMPATVVMKTRPQRQLKAC